MLISLNPAPKADVGRGLELQCNEAADDSRTGHINARLFLYDGTAQAAELVKITDPKECDAFLRRAATTVTGFDCDLGRQALVTILAEVANQLRDHAASRPADREREAVADTIVGLARAALLLFVDQHGTPHTEWEGHGAVGLARGSVGRKLARLYWDSAGKTATPDAVNQARLTLAALADDTRVTLAVRVAEPQPRRVLIDRADGRAIEIDAGGWRPIALPPATFRRFDMQSALCEPDSSGRPADLMQLLELLRIDVDDRLVLACWIVGALLPHIAHPILSAHGPGGAAKSTLVRLMRLLVDPSHDTLHTVPKAGTELGVVAEKRWLLTFDNLSAIPDWLSNILCMTSTGGTMPRRQLYTDSDEILFDLRRIVCLTSVPRVARNEDLLDRLFLLRVERIPDGERLTEEEWDGQVLRLLPRALGGLYSATAQVLAGLDTAPRPERLPRLADWARVAALAAATFGHTAEDFFAAWERVGRRQRSAVAEASVVPAILAHFLSMQEPKYRWEGYVAALQVALTKVAAIQNPPLDKHPDWPKSAAWLSRRLDEQHTALSARGISIQRIERETGTLLTLTCTPIEGAPNTSASRASAPAGGGSTRKSGRHDADVSGATSDDDGTTGGPVAPATDPAVTDAPGSGWRAGATGAILGDALDRNVCTGAVARNTVSAPGDVADGVRSSLFEDNDLDTRDEMCGTNDGSTTTDRGAESRRRMTW